MSNAFIFQNVFPEEQFDVSHLESEPKESESDGYGLDFELEEQYEKLGEITLKDFKPLSQELVPNLDSWEFVEALDSFEAKEIAEDCQALFNVPKFDEQEVQQSAGQVFSLSVEKKEEVSTRACSTESKPSEALKEAAAEEIKVKMCLDRKDVVIKSIFRSMRKYYVDLIQENTNYRRQMRNIPLKHKMLISCSKKMIGSLNFGSFTESLPFFLAAIAFPIDLRKVLAKNSEASPEHKPTFEKASKLIGYIENAQSKFSKKVLDEFMQKPEICILLLNYLSKVESEEYEEHYNMLKDLATQSIERSTEGIVNRGNKVEEIVFDLVK